MAGGDFKGVFIGVNQYVDIIDGSNECIYNGQPTVIRAPDMVLSI